jgi:hypothetical protein
MPAIRYQAHGPAFPKWAARPSHQKGMATIVKEIVQIKVEKRLNQK